MSVLLDNRLGSSVLTIRCILDRIRDDCVKPPVDANHIKEIRVEELAKAGFLSLIFRVWLTLNDGTELKFIVKTPTSSKCEAEVKYDKEGLELFREFLQCMHDTEARFYEEVAPKLQGVPVADAYAYRKCGSPKMLSKGLLVLEDVGDSAGMHDMGNGLTDGQVTSAVRVIAKYHAFTVTLPAHYVESFKPGYSRQFEDHRLHISDRLIAMSPEYFAKHEPALRTFIEQKGDLNLEAYKTFGIPPVLSHGDFWANNLLFKKTPEEVVGDEVHCIVDWQATYPGTGVDDLARLFTSSVNADERQKHTRKWLTSYSEALDKAYQELGVPNPYTLELVNELYRFHYSYELIFTMFLLCNMYPGVQDPLAKKNLLDRCIYGFEEVRKAYEQ
ncbi:Protein C29F7.1 [Aphelenchoides avenae]|nr:Protein C29F7.1 [Aphelenchus avenae]